MYAKLLKEKMDDLWAYCYAHEMVSHPYPPARGKDRLAVMIWKSGRGEDYFAKKARSAA
jgi:hypothetical protein